jgi:hypothetical protein
MPSFMFDELSCIGITEIDIHITQPPPPHVRFIFPCRFGSGVQSAVANANPAAVTGRDVLLPRGTTSAVITYLA